MLSVFQMYHRHFVKPTDERIAGEAVRFVYRYFFPFMFTLPIIILLIMWVLWAHVNHVQLMLWGIASWLLILVRIIQAIAYKRAQPPDAEAHHWGNYLALTALLSGILWGIGAIIFLVPGSTTPQVFFIIVVMGMSAAAAATTSYWLPCFLGFVIPCMGSLIVSMLLRGAFEWTILGIFSGFYFVLLVRLGAVLYKGFVESNLLKFENVALIEELREQKTKAEQANQSKTQFLASASHDLRQPVHALALFADALQYEIDTPKGQDIMNNLTKSIESIDELLSSLLDISKLDAGVVKVNAADIRLKPIISKIRNEFENQAIAGQLKFRVRNTDLSVHSDPVLLTNIVRNLVSNAFRYTKSGGILVVCRKTGDRVNIEVWDTGLGIPEDEQQNIFNEFYQLNNPERDRSKGLGLGLAICQRLSQLLKHQLTMRSTPGKGSVFKISVPFVNLGFAETTVRMFPTNLKPQHHSILVVDDEKEILHAMQAVLESWQYRVMTASSGAEALQFTGSDSASKPDLIICDYRLRNDETGIDVISQIHTALGREIPAIIMTGDTAPERIRETQASGHLLMHKPVKPAGLYTTLQNLLASKQ